MFFSPKSILQLVFLFTPIVQGITMACYSLFSTHAVLLTVSHSCASGLLFGVVYNLDLPLEASFKRHDSRTHLLTTMTELDFSFLNLGLTR